VNVYWLGLLLDGCVDCRQYGRYAIGAATGPGVQPRRSLLFNKKHLNRAHAFYEKHGGVTIILARSCDVRTFVPVVAGIGKCNTALHAVQRHRGRALDLDHAVPSATSGPLHSGVDKHVEVVILLVIFASFCRGSSAGAAS